MLDPGGSIAEAWRTPASLLSLLVCLLRALISVAACALEHACRRRAPTGTTHGCEYFTGRVRHSRLAPVVHHFEYAVRYCLVDLDVGGTPAGCKEQLVGRLSADEARELTGYGGRVRLLLLPASAGYEQNPIVVYYVEDEGGALRCCIAEVSNTPWGDRVRFAFAPAGDAVPKPMHVSPLMDMESTWSLEADAPAETLRLRVACTHPTMGKFFRAALDLRRCPPPADPVRWAWLVPHRVSWWIYWHAAQLIVGKGLSFLQHPRRAEQAEQRAYKSRALQRAAAAGRLSCPAIGTAASAHGAAEACPFSWLDATNYPWD